MSIVGDKTDTQALGGPITYLSHPAQLFRYLTGWIWGARYACVSFYTKAELLQKIASLAERGEMTFEVQEVVADAFDEDTQGWKRAIELIDTARVRGKVVLRIPSD